MTQMLHRCPKRDAPKGKPYLVLFDVVGGKGVGWSLSVDWAKDIIKDFKLDMKQRIPDISGETSALFERNGKTYRLQKDWMGHYKLYLGEWEPDPHWTGD